MATSRRNLRRIVVRGVEYEWRARYRYLRSSAELINVEAFESELTVFRAVPGGRAGFVVRLGPNDPRAVLTGTLLSGCVLAAPVTPRRVRAAIEFALARGWDATRAAAFREIAGFDESAEAAADTPPGV